MITPKQYPTNTYSERDEALSATQIAYEETVLHCLKQNMPPEVVQYMEELESSANPDIFDDFDFSR